MGRHGFKSIEDLTKVNIRRLLQEILDGYPLRGLSP